MLIEDSIRNQISRLGLTVEQIATLSGLRPQAVFSGLSRRRPLSGPQIERLDHTIKNLQTLVQSVPFPLDLSDTKKVKFLLTKLEDGDLARALTPFALVLGEEMERVCV